MTVRPTKVPGFGKLPASMDPQTRLVLEGLIEAVEIRLGRKGDPQDRAITLRELIESGLALQLKASPFDPNRYGAYNLGVGPLTVANMPYAPTGFTANGAYSQVNIFWDGAFYQGHSQTEIYSHTSDSIGDATLAGVSTGISFIDPVGSGVTRYYWIRHVNVNDIKGPFNAAAGTFAQTATDVAHQLAVLSTAITSSQLAGSLSTPIATIPTLATNITALDNFTGYSSSYSGNSLVTRMGAVETTASGAATSAQLSSEATTRANADTAISSTVTTLQSSVGTNTSAIQTEATARANADTAISNTVTALSSTVGTNTSAISTEATTRANADTAISNTVTALNSTVGTNTSAISTEATARANADSAISSTVSTLSSTVGTNTSAISTQVTTTNGLKAQYTVKVDVNGAVAGFGLASTTSVSGNITSEFIVNADRFAIMQGGSNSTTATVPFIVDSGAVFMATAMIKDATITSAKIGSVNADTINAGTLSANRIAAGAIGVNKLNLVGTGATINLASANSGARMIIQGSNITVFDASGTLRVKLGNLS